MNLERANSCQQALQIFEKEIVELSLSYKLTFTGCDPRTAKCWLLHSNGTIADIGNGKGRGLQSEISAKYEALEHYVSTQKSLLQNRCLPFSFGEIEKGLSSLNKEVLPIFFKNSCKIQTIPWVSLKALFGDSYIFLPYFLINPDYCKQTFFYDKFDYAAFPEISTNNGTAIGTTFEEAMLHAINELIERDALSCFLLSTFGKQAFQPIKLINKKTLPDLLFQIIAKIEEDYKEELLVVDISTDLEVPTFLVSFTKQNLCIQPMGFGSSLCSIYSLERAILEALQSFHLCDEATKIEDKQILLRFKQWPKQYQCALCNIRSIVDIGAFTKIEFKDSKKKLFELDVMLYEIVEILEKKGLSIFYALHYQSRNNVSCVKVVIPGLEQFHRVRYGSLVIPGKRGRAVLLS